MTKKVTMGQCSNLENPIACDAYTRLDVSISADDYNKLSKGFWPSTMDDRWIICEDNGEIFFFRSWTGKCIATLVYEKNESGGVFTGIRINSKATEKITQEELVKDVFGVLNQLFGIQL